MVTKAIVYICKKHIVVPWTAIVEGHEIGALGLIEDTVGTVVRTPS